MKPFQVALAAAPFALAAALVPAYASDKPVQNDDWLGSA